MVELRLSDQYIAGLFDGEGSFRINRSRRKDTNWEWSHQGSASITIRERWLLEWIAEEFEGSLHISTKRSDRHATATRWTVGDRKMIPFLNRVGPLLVLKRQQYLVINKFVNMKINHGYGPLNDAQYKARADAFEEMRMLNIRGVDKVYAP